MPRCPAPVNAAATAPRPARPSKVSKAEARDRHRRPPTQPCTCQRSRIERIKNRLAQPATLPASSLRRRLIGGTLLLAIAVPLLFMVTTGQVWEDFLITFRHSRNWVDGLGLTYNPGDRVHGFTSPLNVLLPALGYALFPSASFLPALWFQSGVAIAILAAGLCVLVVRAAEAPETRLKLWALLIPAFTVLQLKTTGFTVNGQEAGFVVGFLALGLLGAWRGFAAAPRFNGIIWGLLMWSRPDAFVYIAALIIGAAFTRPKTWRTELPGGLRAALWAALVYAPWLIFATAYYGSPVPNTVVAKALAGTSVVRPDLIGSLHSVARMPWMATYESAGGWPGWLFVWANTLGLFTLAYGFLPGRDQLGRIASLSLVVVSAYLVMVGYRGFVFPWYCPPAGFLSAVTLACALHRFARYSRGTRISAQAVGAAMIALLGWQFSAGIMVARLHQTEIEYGTRAEVGRWLARHVAADENVSLEPLGYIGYYADAHMDDYPGLVSPRVIAITRAGTRDMFEVFFTLQPDWLVLRSREYKHLSQLPLTWSNYEVQAIFDAMPRLAAYGDLPVGFGILLADRSFVILKKTGPVAPAGI